MDRNGHRYGSPGRLDTVLIDAECMRVELTWRATLPLHGPALARLDLAMKERQATPLAQAGAA
jgi:hypothetical protein